MRTTYLSDRLLNHMYRNTASSQPATVYAGLLTAVTDAEAGTVTEASYSGYARQAITFGAPGAALGGRQIASTGAVTFPAKGDAGSISVIAIGIYDASSAGNLLDIVYVTSTDFPPLAAIANDVTNNFLRAPAHGLANDDQVRVETMPGLDTIPTGLSQNTTYWVRDSATDEFKVSTTQGGAAVDVTAQGEVMVHKLVPITVNQNDQVNFATGAIKVTDD